MKLDKEELESIVMGQIAQKIIESIPEEDKQKILEESLTKTLKEILKPWNIEKAIQPDVNKYMVEFLKRSDVQERLKKATEEQTSKLLNGVVEVIISGAQKQIKSDYANFIEEKKIINVK